MEELKIQLARVEEKIDGIHRMLALYSAQIKQLEGRVWGLAVGLLGTLTAAVISLLK